MNKSKNLTSKTINGLIWSFSELIMNQGFSVIIQVILARLLLPEDFGLIGMITIFISISTSIIDSGLSNALIREEKINDKECSTVFYFNLIISVLVYIILFLVAPYVGHFFNENRLIYILRILAVNIIIDAFGIIQRILLTRKIDFKTQTKISILASVISGIIGIIAARMGLGVWSLIIRAIFMSLIQSILLFVYNKWIPRLVFDICDFKKLFNFGWKMLISSLMDTLYSNLYYIIIGKFFSVLDLGYYTNACKLKDAASKSMTGAVQKVTYPVLSQLNNDDSVRLKNGYKKILKCTAFIIFPVMIGLASSGKLLITIVLGEKWIDSIFYFQILCFEAMLYPLHVINLNILQVKGRSDLFLKLEIIKKGLGLLLIIAALYLKTGIYGILGVAVIDSYISYYINSFYSKYLINYSFKEQVRDLMPSFVMTFIMGMAVCLFEHYISLPNILMLVSQIMIGIIIYIIEGLIFKSEELNIFLNLIINAIKKYKETVK
ncbi:MAG: lipopolysaccharide biosynthesis protein [Clostridium butyricum]|nr:lipopolysaccharide biosynthesis protein [Clostridium butyricum]